MVDNGGDNRHHFWLMFWLFLHFISAIAPSGGMIHCLQLIDIARVVLIQDDTSVQEGLLCMFAQ